MCEIHYFQQLKLNHLPYNSVHAALCVLQWYKLSIFHYIRKANDLFLVVEKVYSRSLYTPHWNFLSKAFDELLGWPPTKPAKCRGESGACPSRPHRCWMLGRSHEGLGASYVLEVRRKHKGCGVYKHMNVGGGGGGGTFVWRVGKRLYDTVHAFSSGYYFKGQFWTITPAKVSI